MDNINSGAILTSESGKKYVVRHVLGAGSRSKVYAVENDDKQFALKWYYKNTATMSQKKAIIELITKGSPDKSFLWPEDLVVDCSDKTFGYIMNFRPQRYRNIVDILRRSVDPSFFVLCKTAINLTKGYQKLHDKGYFYHNIAFDNIFFDPDNGDVLISNNDTVSVHDKDDCLLYASLCFMAPEIILGKAKPSRNTELHSLAVLLFYMFMMNHPLEGKLANEIKFMDLRAMKSLYGTNPVFIYDPKNSTNRPVRGCQDNALIFWNLYPNNLKNVFVQAFTSGLRFPNLRVTENVWIETITKMMSCIVNCPSCGAEVFYDEAKVKLGVNQICWCCQTNFDLHAGFISVKSIDLPIRDTKRHIHAFQTPNEMTDFEKKLYGILSTHRLAIYDRVRLRGLLQDCFPNKKQFINILMILVDMNYLVEMDQVGSCDDLMIQRYANRLESEWAITSEMALQASHALGICYGKYILGAK